MFYNIVKGGNPQMENNKGNNDKTEFGEDMNSDKNKKNSNK
jgi:hypothetical protein